MQCVSTGILSQLVRISAHDLDRTDPSARCSSINLIPFQPALPQWVWRGAGGEVKRLRQEETLIVENWNAMVDGATHDDAPVAVDGCVDKAVFAAVWVAQ